MPHHHGHSGHGGHHGGHGGHHIFGSPSHRHHHQLGHGPYPGATLLAGALLGGAVGFSAPRPQPTTVVYSAPRPPPPCAYRRGERYRQVVVVREPPRGTAAVVAPSEQLVLVTCPHGVRPGDAIEIEVEGRAFSVTIPQGIGPGQPFYAKIPRARVVFTSPPPPLPVVTGAVQPERHRQVPSAAPVGNPVGNPVGWSDAPLAQIVAVEPPPAAAPVAAPVISSANPFGPASGDGARGDAWVVTPALKNEEQEKGFKSSKCARGFRVLQVEFDAHFTAAGPSAAAPGSSRPVLSPTKVREALTRTGLAREVLRLVWELSDLDRDGALDADEFAVAMWLCRESLEGRPPPCKLPTNVIPPSKRNPF